MQRTLLNRVGVFALCAGVGLAASSLLVAQQQQRQSTRDQTGQRQTNQNATGQKEFCLATKLIGTKVKAKGEEDAGKIENLIINKDGEVQYLAISSHSQSSTSATPQTDRSQPQSTQQQSTQQQSTQQNPLTGQTSQAAGRSGQWTLIPWDLAEFHEGTTPDQQYVSVDVEKDRLMTAPSFSEQQLMAEASQSRVTMQVDQYFGERRQRGAARPDLNRDRQNPNNREPESDNNSPTTPQPR